MDFLNLILKNYVDIKMSLKNELTLSLFSINEISLLSLVFILSTPTIFTSLSYI